MNAEVVPPAGPVLAVEGLGIRYGRDPLLKGLSLTVSAGEVYALLGRNGSGKTSLVRCLLGEQKPQEGRVLVMGQDVWTARERLMERVGVLPEEPDAPPSLSARELSAFCRRVYPRWDEGAVVARLDRFGIPTDRAFSRLSRGERGAVMLALCLGHSPECLVLDDPTLGQDAVARRALFEEVISELAARGTTVFVTSHDLAGIEGLADRVGVLHGGRLLLEEPVDSLKQRYRRLRIPADAPAEWAGFSVVVSRRAAFSHEAIVSDFAEDRLRHFASSSPEGVEVDDLSLEEIFLAVCGEKGGRA